ncbi:hypothetical protein ACFLYK_02785 [Candidatus Cloacimonadota bacterium]
MNEHILNDATTTYLISKQGINDHIVVGVPHHAPFGNNLLPTPNKRPADENVGYLGVELARTLQCSYIVACNYSFDVNKFWTSDYSRTIKNWQPQILIEVHGHGGGNALFDVEITTGGPERNALSKHLAKQLIDINSTNKDLAEITISGNFPDIWFQATKTKTINTNKWQSLHIELPLQIRRPSADSGNKPSELGYKFCENLAEALKQTFSANNIELK